MPSHTNEQALEAVIEKKLTGTTRKELKTQGVTSAWAESTETYRSGNGYWMGETTDFNPDYAIDTRRFWHFLTTTQPLELAKLQTQPQWELLILQKLDRVIKKYGVTHLFRKGLDIDDAHFTLLYVPPLASSSKSVKDAFPEEQRVKFVSILKYVQQQPNYQTHVVNNTDVQNRDLALQKMINDAINQQRKSELELYKLYSQDPAFKQAMQDSVRRMLGL